MVAPSAENARAVAVTPTRGVQKFGVKSGDATLTVR
jgi:hypothetical protein